MGSPFREVPGADREVAGSVSGVPVGAAGPSAAAADRAVVGRVTGGEGSGEPGVLVSPAAPRPLVRARRAEPRSGVRRWVHVLTGGAVNPGPSRAERVVLSRRDRLLQPMAREFHVTTYLCLKGGIAKTSTAIGVSKTMAQARPDATLLADFNPDAGDAAERTVGQSLGGVTRLAEHAERVESVGQLYRYLATSGRLVVLPGEPDPRLGDSLSSGQFTAVLQVTRRYFANIHIDAGTGITHPCMPGILGATDTVVIPAAYSITGARRAAHTIDWLRSNGYPHLAQAAIVALTDSHRVSGAVDRGAVRDLFAGQAVVYVPNDPHVADGAVIDLDRLQTRTRDAYAEIAAQVADQFTRTRTK